MMDDTIIKKSALVRKWSLISTTEAGSGHPTSCLSAADIMTVLFDKYFSYDLDNPLNYTNDRLIFSKGHAAPLFYALYALAGAYPLEELKTLRKFGSRLEGHPTMEFPYTDAATGSLGQGLSVGAGLAYGISNFKFQISNLPKVYVLLGDGELAEGQIWEAANFASHYKLNNLVAIADINRLAQSQETMFGHKVEEYKNRFEAFGFETLVIDGHNLEEIDNAFSQAISNTSDKPFAIIAKTFKGKGISFLENKEDWHGKALKKEDLTTALLELGDIDDELRFKLREPKGSSVIPDGDPESLKGKPKEILNQVQDDTLKLGDEIATRDIYGKVLSQLANTDSSIMSLDGDVKNSTFAIDFLKAHPERFIECFIAEQNMVSVAVGLSRLNRIPFVSTFAAFFTRASDQIRMAGLSHANIKFVGSHAGVSIGEDGASQMGLEDFALFGTIPGSVIMHPSDAVSAAKILPLLAQHVGISYLRTLRPKTSVLYEVSEEFKIGGSKILKSSPSDILTIIAAGITVSEALKAYEELKKENIMVRVIDCYSIKPIDKATIEQSSNETTKKIIITVEDHYQHGGLGDFVVSALSRSGIQIEKMAVTKIPRSGLKDELLDYEGISSSHIIKKVKNLLKE